MVFRTHLYHLYRLKLLFLCAAALTGCDDKELINPGGRAISFSVADTGFPADTDGTRSADSAPRHHSQPLGESGLYLHTTVEPMQPVTRAVTEFSDFGVFAYMDNEPFMNNVKVYSNDEGVNWTYDNTMYWPTGTHTMNFYAYANYNPSFDGTFLYDIESDDDLMAATESVTLPPSQTSVNFTFEHLLTKVTVKTNGSFSKYLTVKSVTFKNILYKECTYNIKEARWKETGDKGDYLYPWNAVGPNQEEIFMMLPQDLTDATIEVVVSDGSTDKTFSASLKNDDAPWNKGNAITYTISPENIKIESWEESANCYMLKPTNRGTVYRIPIKDRINEFWSSSLGNGTSPIDGSTEWTAEVIWQDYNDQIITFCDAFGENENNTWNAKGDAFYVKTTKVSGDGYLGGNVLVGVKPKSETGTSNYLWSWHLWITDYDPDGAPSTGITDYVQNVTGGAVHRYVDNEDNYLGGFEKSHIEGNKVWSSIYKDKYIMDRNLGALSTEPTDGLAKTAGMYYQFGRKDPFPGATYNGTTYNYISLYDITGKTETSYTPSSGDNIIKQQGQETMSGAVKNPHTFYFPAPGDDTEKGDWMNPNNFVAYPWNNPNVTSTNDYSKGIFDPCPPGWKIPQIGTWDAFVYRNQTTEDDYSFSKGQYINNSTFGGIYFNINGTNGGETAFYPTSNYRSYQTGGFWSAYNTYGYAWSSSINEKKSGCFLFFDRGGSYPKLKTHRSAAFPVRCIRE